jgi:hypothetical protein
MPTLVSIVEGDGEVAALPILLNRLLKENRREDLRIARPKNAHGHTNLRKDGGIERFVELAFREKGCAGVLVLLDCDETSECPASVARKLAVRINAQSPRHPVAIVCARREYEAWFLASLETLVGKRIDQRPGLPANLKAPDQPEEIRDAKRWLSRQLPGSRAYKETEDQAPLSRLIDLDLARSRSRSFLRLSHAVENLLQAINQGTCQVTPAEPPLQRPTERKRSRQHP